MPSSRSIAPQVTEPEPRAAMTAATASLKASLTDLLDDMATRAAGIICTEVPSYFEASDALFDDVPQHVITHLSTIEVAATHAAEVYLEAEEQLAATGERVRRDLLEDLIAGVPLATGPRLDAARAAGLRPGVHSVVISATPAVPCEDQHMLRGAAASLARAAGTPVAPLTVLRHGEIDVVVPVRGDGAAKPVEGRITSSQQRLATGGLPLSVGISTEVSGTEQIANAYRELESARLALGPDPGVMALTGMSAFEYLTLGADPTASRPIAPAVAQFVAEDADQGGVLIQTLREYVSCDLNARRTAERLYIHVNTCHYRLGRIAERTGCDLHRVTDLIEILIAARMRPAG